ncbi:MAG: cysteine synthase A [Atopobium sp.]|uniref:cysteine synthase A n=1 Tax=Atopobium sp. TaxID=1872650 RepID=UPI002A747C11|nr:cysteine synthase A [Atopobium sp.]MDY2788990.1 cysteine synthase A [Atopobium sp.]
MKIAQHVEALVGKTPLIDISGFGSGKARILAKYEATNPGGSVKDRVAKFMVDAAEKDGSLAAGGTIIEPTSGNTGVGLAMIAAARGYHMVLVMPETMSIERRKLAASYGAKIVLTPGAAGMKGALAKAYNLQQTIPNSVMLGQFDNPANPRAHYLTTGPEIWFDTEGRVDALVAGVGTGGTISGSAQYLKEQNSQLRAFAVEPAESPVLSGGKPGPHKIQGIGAGFIPQNYNASLIDEVLTVTSSDAIATKKSLAEAGLLVGISSGAAVAAAARLSLRPELAGKTIVTVLPDTGERYLSMEL